MAERETSFISRWSRRKREPRSEDEPAAERENVARQSAAVTTPAAESGEATDGDPEVVAKLPDIESLNEASDFTPFMEKGVPEVLRRRALRKLWRLNPVFANLDGLNDYDEDFTDAANLLAEIKTIYKVGKGMASEETAEGTSGAEASREEKPQEPQFAEGTAEPPAISQKTSASPEDEAGLDAIVLADDVAEPVPLPDDDEEAVGGDDARATSSRRSAAARRWGESSE